MVSGADTGVFVGWFIGEGGSYPQLYPIYNIHLQLNFSLTWKPKGENTRLRSYHFAFLFWCVLSFLVPYFYSNAECTYRIIKIVSLQSSRIRLSRKQKSKKEMKKKEPVDMRCLLKL